MKSRTTKRPRTRPRAADAAPVAARIALRDDAGTRRRLMDAAAQVFARDGFRDATVRDICALAGANIASVNYYFGGKAALYRAVIEHACRDKIDRHPGPTDANTPAEERLHAFIRAALMRLLEDGQAEWPHQLMNREMIEPTPALDFIVEEAIRPQFSMLRAIVAELLGPGAAEATIRACAFSVIGQCLFYRHSHAVATRLYPDMTFGGAEIDRLAGHIHRFSIGALRALRQGQRGAGRD